MTPIVTVEINGQRTVLDGRSAQIVSEVVRVLPRLERIRVGHIAVHFAHDAVKSPQIMEQALPAPVEAAMATASVG